MDKWFDEYGINKYIEGLYFDAPTAYTITKINEISKNTDDYERKIMKLKKEITSKEREVASIINKSNIEKEKLKNQVLKSRLQFI